MKPHNHKPVQHRDGKPPWCNECGLTRDLQIPIWMFNKKENDNMVDTTTYVRKPFEVEAVQVTEENIEAVKDWCQGNLEMDNRQYIKVRVARALNERQTKAYPGDWVLYAGTGFKVYTNKAFHKTFERQSGVVIDNAVQAEKEQPQELLTTSQVAKAKAETTETTDTE